MERDLYKEYCFVRHMVQMKNACLVAAKVEKYIENIEGEIVNEIGVGRKVEAENDKYYGYIKVDVAAAIKATNEPVFKIEIIYKGCFEGSGSEDLSEFVFKQTVPQLYPFVRGAIATITGLMQIPTITLPTIDVLASLEKND